MAQFMDAFYPKDDLPLPGDASAAGVAGPKPDAGAPPMPSPASPYSPSNPNPYVAAASSAAAQTPKIEPPPQIQPPHQAQSPGMVGGRGAALTSIATMGDSILRGAMQGREMKQQRQAAKTQKLMNGLQYNYSKAQANVMDIAQQPDVSAVLQKQYQDPKYKLTETDTKALTPYNEALAGASSAWMMLDNMTNRYFFGDPDKAGKGKGKGKSKDQPENPMAMAASNDPQEKLKGILMVRSKIGDTTPMRVREMMAKASDPGAQVDRLTNENKLQYQKKLQEALKLPAGPQRDAALKETEDLAAVMSGKPAAAGSWKRIDGTLNGQPFSYMHDEKLNKNTTLGGAELQPEALTGFTPAAKTSGKPLTGWSKDAHGRYFSAQIDPSTNQFKPGTENYSQEPPAYLRESIRTGDYHWVDEDGKVHATPTTSVSRHVVPGGGGGAGAGAGAGTPSQPRTMVTPHPPGLVTPGNISIDNRPVVQNTDGSHSSEFSFSFADGKGHEVLVPTVVGGKFLTPDGKKPKPGSPEEEGMKRLAWKHYQDTGQHLGIFDNVAHADAYANQLHNRGDQRPQSTQPAHPSAHGATGAASTPHAAGDRILGDRGAPVDKQVRASVISRSNQVGKLVPMWEASSEYMSKIDKGGKPDSAGDLSMVVAAVRAMNPASSRLPDRELRLEMERGSYGERAQRWYTQASSGVMPDHMRRELWDVVNSEIPRAAEHVAADWQTSMQNRPLPSHLSRFTKTPSANTNTSGGGPGKIAQTPDEIPDRR